MSDTPKVSVAITVYNQEQYIERCIDSVLSQKTVFDYEIVVGEDYSSDNSRKILLDLKNSYPDKIKLILNEENVGININFMRVMDKCEGHYVANLDGDDYWIDELKLQKQVDFMDAHPNYSMCTTAFELEFENSGKNNIVRPGEKNSYTVEEILQHNIIMGSSIMFRRDYVQQPPEGYYQFPYQDWQMWVHIAKQGPVKYMDEVTSVNRIHESNIYGNLSDVDKWKASSNVREILVKNLDHELRPYCYHSLFTFYKRIMYACRADNKGKEVREYANKCLGLLKYYQSDPFWERLELFYYGFVYTPWIHQVVYPMLQAGKNGLKPIREGIKF